MKRCTIVVLLFLLAGGVLNIVVAWGAATGINNYQFTNETGMTVDDGTQWAINRYASPFATRVGSSRYQTDSRIEFGVHPSELVPGWTGFDTPWVEFADGREIREARYAVGFGWPLVSMSFWETGGVIRNGIKLSAPTPTQTHQIVIPLKPAWSGFTINTIFYSAVIVLLTLVVKAPSFVRRRLRIRRGCCGRCGQLRHEDSICTECGRSDSDDPTGTEDVDVS